ncbi:alkyl sulfatase C-terminal domain-containing protein [Nocardia sp. NPDC058480]|uniref:alkyl sulfatase C-terminal domain-containing protein n=1 Tax=unclassified Nocardia TaxID=2637762 RepID=UPI00365BA54A
MVRRCEIRTSARATSTLWEHPREEKAARYVETIGGIEAVIEKGRAYAESGDLRFAAELLTHAVFAEPGNKAAKDALAQTYQQLGFGAENATWRCFYLTGDHELRQGIQPTAMDLGGGMAAALSVDQLFDTVAIRVNGPRAAKDSFRIEWHFTDQDTIVRLTLSNGVLIQTPNPRSKADIDLTVNLTKPQLLGILAGKGLDGIDCSGDPGVLQRLFGVLDTPDPNFAVVTP